LDKIQSKTTTIWMPFLVEKFKSSIIKCSNTSTPGPDKLSWRHLKVIVNDSTYLNNFINIANVCIVIRQKCGQTLGLGLVDRDRTVVYY